MFCLVRRIQQHTNNEQRTFVNIHNNRLAKVLLFIYARVHMGPIPNQTNYWSLYLGKWSRNDAISWLKVQFITSLLNCDRISNNPRILSKICQTEMQRIVESATLAIYIRDNTMDIWPTAIIFLAIVIWWGRIVRRQCMITQQHYRS